MKKTKLNVNEISNNKTEKGKVVKYEPRNQLSTISTQYLTAAYSQHACSTFIISYNDIEVVCEFLKQLSR